MHDFVNYDMFIFYSFLLQSESYENFLQLSEVQLNINNRESQKNAFNRTALT